MIEGGDEESAGPTVAGTVDDEEGDRADRPSKPAPRRQSQSHGRSQSQRPRKRVKSSTFVQDDDDHDESIPAPAPHHTPSYNIYNPPNTHQIVDDDARCALCARHGLLCAIKEVGHACYQCNNTKHACSLVIRRRCSRSRSRAPTTARRSPTPGSSMQPTCTNPPRSTRKRKTHSPSAHLTPTERSQQSVFFFIHFLFYSYSKQHSMEWS